MKFNLWNKWDPLRVCMLGNNYAPEFFDGVPKRVGDPLKRVCEETLEDLECFKKVLQDFGVTVIQPEMDRSERFIDNPFTIGYANRKDSYLLKTPQAMEHGIRRGPLMPRDENLVIGNACYINGNDHPAIEEKLKQYGPCKDHRNIDHPHVMTEEYYNIIKGIDYPSYQYFMDHRFVESFFEPHVWQELCNYKMHSGLNSASTFPLGKHFLIGCDYTNAHVYNAEQVNLCLPETTKFKIVETDMDGHTDGTFHPVKPGAIISVRDVQNYEKTFPGWDVCYLRDENWNKVKHWQELKLENHGKWWLPGEEQNSYFTHFVETWLQDWVGYVEESVFDVNVLMLDENHCVVNNLNNKKVNAFFKKHKIEPVHVPWRHRFFWDGGIHCITLELIREGTQQDYFS